MDTSSRLANRCSRRNHERQMIGEQHHRHQPVILRIVADHAQFQIAVNQLRWNLARKRPPHLHLHFRIQPPIALDMPQQIQRRRLVRPHRQPSRPSCRAVPPAHSPAPPPDSRTAARIRKRSARHRSEAAPCPSGRSAAPANPTPASEPPAKPPAVFAAAFRPAREKLFSLATVRKTFRGYSSISEVYVIIII